MRDWLDDAAALRAAGKPFVMAAVLGARGSSPRERGARMLVAADNFFGSIGGGRLEWRALETARKMLKEKFPPQRVEAVSLGASLGQCCGGRVILHFELVEGRAPVIALFGAGHVGRELARILTRLPREVWWIDSRPGAFPPESEIAGARRVRSDHPADEVADLPPGAHAAVMTHSHALDFAVCAAALARGDLASVGVIGSESKGKSFRARLRRRGIAPGLLRCPMGGAAQAGGKNPAEVAVAVAAELSALTAARPPQLQKEEARLLEAAADEAAA